MVNASVTASYSQSSYESNTSGTKSIAGVINVGGNMVIQSEGDVKLVNQKITVGENIIIDAKNFEALAGENTYKNDTKSNSMGMNVGYDIVNQNALGGLNASTGNSNTTSKSYDNTFISAGGTFQLTTKEDATFKGANVIADKINFDIGKNLNIISLQDEYKTHGENKSVGINVSGLKPGTQTQTGTAIPTIGGGYSQNDAESKWVSNQTSIVANNGGSIKVNETLTNIGAIIGSLSDENKLGIDAKKVVIENLKDYNKGENSGIEVSGIGKGTIVPQTGIQYGSHDKEQDTNATFVNTEVTENGVKLDLEKLGINTDITKAQVVTKDEVVDQIDTVIHTDLLNETTRNQVMEDILKTGALIPEVIQGISEAGDGKTVAGQIANNLIETKDNIHTFVTDRDNKQKEKAKEMLDKNNGELSKELLEDTAKYIQETLDAAGKGDYEVIYSSGEDDPAMSINDSKKQIIVNVDKTDFTDTETIRKNAQHESVHNRYVDEGTDENAAQSIYNKPDKIVDNKIPDDLKELLTQGKELYDEGVKNGEFRDKANEGAGYRKGNLLNINRPNGDKSKYSKIEIQDNINWWFGKGYEIDWTKYSKSPNYREEVNYYYFQAKYSLRVTSVDKVENGYVTITQKNGKQMTLQQVSEQESLYHNAEHKDGTAFLYFNNKYKKYVQDDGYELILDKNNNPVYNPAITGTYNYYTYNLKSGLENPDKIAHGADITLWIKYGSGPTDKTDPQVRKKLGDLSFGKYVQDNYNKLKQISNYEKIPLSIEKIESIKKEGIDKYMNKKGIK